MTSIPIWAPGNNTANFNFCASWNDLSGSPYPSGNVTTVGTNGGPSYYGTYDMSGNINEWNDLSGNISISKGLRGGSWSSQSVNILSSAYRDMYGADIKSSSVGFRIASASNPFNMPYFSFIHNAGNISDSTGYGSVPYEYYIGTYPVTNCEYAEFLNRVAATDTYNLYDSSMGSDIRGGIIREGSDGEYTYTIKSNMNDKPVIYISWFECARYCNWLHNGKPSGTQNNNTTEDGAYTLNGITSGNTVVKKINAKYHIPIENEWYKAAYYDASSPQKYWLYATQYNTAPICVSADEIGNGIYGESSIVTNYDCDTALPSPTPTPTPTPTPVPCDRKIIKLYIPGSIIEPGGVRATSIQLKLKGDDPKCCGESNEVSVTIPPITPPNPTSPPDECISDGLDLYGYTAIIAYDPENCSAGHSCNRAIFDFYINSYYIGQANLNNGNDGGYREGVFIINEHIIVSSSTTFEIRCALSGCHQGIGRLVIKNTLDEVVLAACMPNDVIVGANGLICPTPTPSNTATITPTNTLTATPTQTPTQTPPPSLDWRFIGSSYWPAYNISINQTISSSSVNDSFSSSSISLSTIQKYYGGVLLPDGKVFCVPYSASRPLIYDSSTDTSFEATGLSGSTFNGGVLMKDGRVFMVPLGGTSARIYDPSTNIVSIAGGTYPGSGGLGGGVLLPDGRVFCIPRNSSTAIIYDPTTDSASTPTGNYGTDATKFIGGVLLPDGRVFLSPYNSTVIKIYDPASDTVFTSGVTYPSGVGRFLGSVLLPDGRIFSVPHYNTTARIYDPASDTVSTPTGSYPGNLAFAGGVLLPNGKVFCVPRTSSTAIVYDPISDTTSTASGVLPGTNRFTGGVVMADGRVFCVPWEINTIYLYGGNTGFNINVSLSSYYNRL